jgi:hypothetical protein
MEAAGQSSPSSQTEAAAEIMKDFAERTGLSSSAPQARYLWTDAFAVCNYLTLYGRTSDARYRDLTVLLIDSVHHVLGRHRHDDRRRGWISGLSEEEGERHPTAGGLRIGKRLNERREQDLYDAQLEWERDGQYYHYLVRWIHALGRAGDVLGHPGYHRWAAELGEAAHTAFVYAPWPGAANRMRWKMSIDLTRVLVGSEGAHDPLDGLVTASALRAAWPETLTPRADLDRQIDELWEMCAGRTWATEDPLGAGGLLMDACWVTGLAGGTESRREAHGSLALQLWEDSLRSLSAVARAYPFSRPPDDRLAFRELGLAIGLLAVETMLEDPAGFPDAVTREAAEALRSYLPRAGDVVSQWVSPAAQETPSWKAHEDINAVMLATALAPDGYLGL